MNRDAIFAGILVQQVEQPLIIRWPCKNYLPVVATLDDVMRIARNAKAGQSCHGDAEDVTAPS
jgi:hypothetical protein